MKRDALRIERKLGDVMLIGKFAKSAALLLTVVFGMMEAGLTYAQAKEAAPQRFRVEVSGKGSDVVLIPGLASGGAVWADTAKQLAADHRVHVVQVAGFAGLPAGPNAEGEVLGPLVEEIADYVSRLDRPAIIGHSLGGLAALEVAALKPEEVGRVMVVDALPFYALIMNPNATVDMVRPQAEAMKQQIIAASADAFANGQKATMTRLVKSPEGQAMAVDWSLTSDRRVMAQALYDDVVTDARARLGSIRAPVTVVYAWDERMGAPREAIDAIYAGAYKGLQGARLKRIDGGFHFIMLDQPKAFAEAVTDFKR
jgi:pimeloyl-ACP methyl ester carboxylesterase